MIRELYGYLLEQSLSEYNIDLDESVPGIRLIRSEDTPEIVIVVTYNEVDEFFCMSELRYQDDTYMTVLECINNKEGIKEFSDVVDTIADWL